MNPLLELRQQGQSVWLDYMSRELVRGGGLERLVREDGLGGVTSNPTIFEKAIAHTGDYDEQLRALLRATPGIDTQSLFEALAIDDIRGAADLLRVPFDRTDGNDGYASFEVPASAADDTAVTMTEARRLWKAIDRPNVMIKVPATPAGIPAIEQLTAEGININITLMFSLEHYEQVAHAYIRGLERCARPGSIASVASFFVSRVDTMVDKQLERLGTPEALALRGRIAIANSRIVYQRFREIFYGAAFAPLRARGCRVQRPLWASTSTKNPAYRDVVYVEELIGSDTVNTMPPATVDAFRDHGKVRGASVDEQVDLARRELATLSRVGIDLDTVARSLQIDGVAAFAKSYDDLAAVLEKKRKALMVGGLAGGDADPTAGGSGAGVAASGAASPAAKGPAVSLQLPRDLGERVTARLNRWQEDGVCGRIWARDPTVWSAAPVPELADRLGWLSTPTEMAEHARELSAFAEEVRQAGITHLVLLGMGGSSLAPEVFQATFGARAGFPSLTVLDSTHPQAVRDVEGRLDLARTLFLVSSKSGTTTETNSFFQYFWGCYGPGSAAGAHFAAITDPGTPLERLARERGFRRIFSAPPDVGGRYSALTVFGLVPAALAGVEVAAVLERAGRMAEAIAVCSPVTDNPGLTLGAALGELALAGRDKLTFFVSPPLASLPAWLEQLIAESTGKNGKGIVPVADEPALALEQYGGDRVFVSIEVAEGGGRTAESKGRGATGGERGAGGAPVEQEKLLDALAKAGHPVIRLTLASPLDLGAEFFRWEFAVAAAGAILGIQPFDQPDVQLAKELARKAMAGAGGGGGASAAPVTDPGAWRPALEEWLSAARPGDYLGLQAYLAPSAQTTAALQRVRGMLARRTGLATTLGYGPRFLHSTGQLHKGGPGSGLFLQLVDAATPDLGVPESTYTFGQLIRGQAAGDAMALMQRGRRVLRIGLGEDAVRGLTALQDLVG